MKKINLIALFVMLILAACAPQTSGNSTSSPTSTQSAADLSPAQRAAIASLSQSLNLSPEKITIASSESVTWPNGCMGVQRMGVMCAPNATPGFRITLSANGKQYEFHTNQDGSIIVPIEPMQAPSLAQDIAIKQLAAKLGAQESAISVVSNVAVQWADSCLGIATAGTTCAETITPGYLIVLEESGTQYEYHTNDDGSVILLAP